RVVARRLTHLDELLDVAARELLERPEKHLADIGRAHHDPAHHPEITRYELPFHLIPRGDDNLFVDLRPDAIRIPRLGHCPPLIVESTLTLACEESKKLHSFAPQPGWRNGRRRGLKILRP